MFPSSKARDQLVLKIIWEPPRTSDLGSFPVPSEVKIFCKELKYPLILFQHVMVKFDSDHHVIPVNVQNALTVASHEINVCALLRSNNYHATETNTVFLAEIAEKPITQTLLYNPEMPPNCLPLYVVCGSWAFLLMPWGHTAQHDFSHTWT